MGFQRFASFAVTAKAIASADGTLPAEVMPTAGSAFTRTAHRHVFSYKPKPGYLYVRSRAISSRVNDNFDEFPAPEIKAAYRTFVGKPVFVNHHNADHRRARGVIIDAALHEDVNPDGTPDTWAEVLMEVDAVRFPLLARAVIAGHIDRTSMGTDVAYSECTYCGNKASLPSEYCAHIPQMKGQRITRRTASGTQEAVLVAERCYGLGFFENSLLVEQPADPTAYTFGLDTRGLENEPTYAGLIRRAAALRAVEAEVEEAFEDTDEDLIAAFAALDGEAKGSGPETSGRFKGVTLDQDDKGHYVKTHRARSDSYPSPEDIPDSKIEFIRSTGSRVAMQPRDTPAEAYGLTFDPTGEHNPDVLAARSFTGWDHLPTVRVPIADLVATEGVLSSGSVNKHVKSAPIPGYYVQVVHSRDGRLYIADGHHRVAIETLRGNPTVEARVLDLSSQQVAASRKTAGWMEEIPDERWFYDAEPVGEGSVTAEVGGPASDFTGRYEWWAFNYDRSPVSGVEHSLAQAKVTVEQAVHGNRLVSLRTAAYGEKITVDASDLREGDRLDISGKTRIDKIHPRGDKVLARTVTTGTRSPSVQAWALTDKVTVWRKQAGLAALAYGEQKAPPEVDTLRDEACPVCGDSASFNGQRCAVCGFVKPPAKFDDPDLSKAKQVDLRGGDVEQATEPQTLRCTNCGTTYDKPGDPTAKVTTPPTTGPSAVGPSGIGVTSAGKPPWLKAKDEDKDKDETDKAKSGPRQDPGQDAQVDPDKAQTKAPADQDAQDGSDGPQAGQEAGPQSPPKVEVDPSTLNAGDTCPTCGSGTLEPADAATEDPSQLEPGADAPSAVAPEDDQDTDQDLADALDDDDQDDEKDPPEGSEPDDDSDDEKAKKAPPWLKKKTSSHTAGQHPKETVGMSGQQTNPAQERRNRLVALLKQQNDTITAQSQTIESLVDQVEKQRVALTTLAKAAGVAKHPHFAALVAEGADENKEPVATTDEQALAPAAKDDPEAVGAVPAPANTGVTPGATSDAQSADVALDAEPFNSLVNVTEQPGAAVDPPSLQESHIKTDVKVGNPSQEPFDNVGGWKQSAVQAEPEDPQRRFVASLNLARLQIGAGIAEGENDDLALGQRIHDDTAQSLAAIEAQAQVLTRVAAAGQPSRQATASRSLVPQPAGTRRSPSLAGRGVQASDSVSTVSSDELGFLG
jgi:hypothetical protein